MADAEVFFFNGVKRDEQKPADPLRCYGIGRDPENDQVLFLSFNRKPTDDQVRFIHDTMKRLEAVLK